MRLESFRKPLDYDVERKNLEGTYTKNETDSEVEIDSYDLLFDEEDIKDEGFLESEAIRRGVEESAIEEVWSANDIGKEFINTPTLEKKQAEKQDYNMKPLPKEVFQEIADDADKEDLTLQAKIDSIVAELEGIF